jgi:ribosomal protein S18 acetylase RimI-like enzyme
VIIRDADREDVARLAPLVAEQELLVRYAMTAERLEQQLMTALTRGDTVIVSEQEGEPVGFAWFLPSGTFASGGYLRLIALAPGHEGEGHGAALLDEMERRLAQTARHAFLLVSNWNEGARRFYARRGYQEVGVLPGFVMPDTDEIICWKRLR